MKPFKLFLFSVCASLFASANSSPSYALASDREQPIYIESDSAERDDKKGITTYQGKVKMDQGSMRIVADKITIHSVDNRVHMIVATGKPARYQQKPSPDKELVVAEGGTIRYEIDPERLELVKNASIMQEGTTMSGDRIDYNITESLVKAAGDAHSSNQRIKMVIPPATKE